MESDNIVPLASLSLTHVQFEPHDKIGYLFAYITLIPLAILVFYVSLILARREVVAVLVLTGQLLNEALNTVLKESIHMSRPYDHLGTGYGMPSSHAQFMSFFATFCCIYLWNHICIDSTLFKTFLSAAMVGVSIAVAISRVYLGYHSTDQVLAGATIGCITAAAWYILIESYVRPAGWIHDILRHPFAKWLYLKDGRCIDNTIRWEYQNWERQFNEHLKRENQTLSNNNAMKTD